MKFNIIDKNEWNRVNTYNQFSKITPCTYSMTVNLDITLLYKTVKGNNLKFFPSILYGIAKTVNKNKEFRMDTDKSGNVGFYDISNPCFTVFDNKTETFSNVCTKYNTDYSVFLKNYLIDIKKSTHNSKTLSSEQMPNIFNVSCIPWTSFTGFNLNLQKGYDYFAPIFTIGKYYDDNGKLLLPLAIQVHHAVCDGFHLSRFVNKLQLWANEFTL